MSLLFSKIIFFMHLYDGIILMVCSNHNLIITLVIFMLFQHYFLCLTEIRKNLKIYDLIIDPYYHLWYDPNLDKYLLIPTEKANVIFLLCTVCRVNYVISRDVFCQIDFLISKHACNFCFTPTLLFDMLGCLLIGNTDSRGFTL